MKKLLITKALVLLSFCLVGQASISGVVTDPSGSPLIGVNIVELGTSNGTISDIDGSYQISVGPNASLVFSFTGMRTVTEEVGTRSTIDIILEEDSELLVEVIVTALGFRVKKDETGSTASVVQPEDIYRSGEIYIVECIGSKSI